MCVIYFFAGVSKLQGPSWWDGEAMWRAFANLEYQSLDMTWLAWHPWLVNAMSHVVGPVGDLVLRSDLAEALAAARAGGGRGAARRHRRVPGNVDVRADHAGRVCVVPACRAFPDGPRPFTSTARPYRRAPRESFGEVWRINRRTSRGLRDFTVKPRHRAASLNVELDGGPLSRGRRWDAHSNRRISRRKSKRVKLMANALEGLYAPFRLHRSEIWLYAMRLT